MSKRASPLSILDTISDRKLFAPWFKDEATWSAWVAFLSALYALPMSEEQLQTYRQCTGRNEPPTTPAREGWLACGRRSGKSFILALIAVYLACFHSYRQYLVRGERGTLLIIAADRKQSRTILRYIRGFLTGVPMLARMIENEKADGFDLSNNVTIEIGTASFRSVRGYTCIGILCDEIAFWRIDETSSNPDHEILDALRPSMATIPNAVLLCASSPYSRKGELYEAHRRHYGQDNDPVLVWQAPTLTMNPTVPTSVIDEAFERDPTSASAEFGGQFRADLSGFLDRELVEQAVDRDVRVRPPQPNIKYSSFCDTSGGRGDSFTCGISHAEGQTAVLDVLLEFRSPFDPSTITRDVCTVLRTYGISRTVADHYSANWAVGSFAKNGIRLENSERNRSELYLDALPLFTSGRVRLIDNTRLSSQLYNLERRTFSSGLDKINHPAGGNDDCANSACGALVLAGGHKSLGVSQEFLKYARQRLGTTYADAPGTTRQLTPLGGRGRLTPLGRRRRLG